MENILHAALKPFTDWVAAQPALSLLAALTLWLLALGLASLALFRLGGISRRQERLLAGLSSGDLEKSLKDCLADNAALRADLDAVRKSDADRRGEIGRCLQGVSLVRYDAVANVAGGQSFSVALLDGAGDGLVLTALQTRQEMRVFGKPVAGGASTMPLTDEEKQAIAGARAS